MSSRIERYLGTALVLVLVLATPSLAQTATGTIAGRVVDRQSQQPIAGVQLRVAGSARGAQSDDQGAYRIPGVPAGSVTLTAQRIGYSPSSRVVAVTAGGTATADFTLAMGTVTLDQVTVTATGQSERRRESGVSTAVLDSSMINKSTVSTLADVLSSRAPGVVVQQSSGQTGTGARIRIRGSNSISLSNDPLVIVDGVRFDNNSNGPASANGTPIATGGQVPSRFNDLNPEEIESIEIIKGPAAASLYGTAAANGVIQITTKKGRAGRSRWDAFTEYGTLQDVNDYPVNYRSFGHNAAGGRVTNCSLYSRTSTSATHCVAVDSTITNSPLEAAGALQDGNRRMAGLSVAGGSDAATYFLSTEYQKEQNVVPINAQQRLNIRTNLRGQLTKALDAQVNIGYTNSDLRRPQNDNNVLGVVSAALLGSAADCGPGGLAAEHPTLCGSDTTSRGYYNGQPPQAVYNIDTRQKVQRFTGGITSNFTPATWLAFNGTLGADVNHQDDIETLQPGIVDFAQATFDGYRQVSRGVTSDYTASLNGTATYDFSQTMRFISTLGTQYTDVDYTRADAYGQRLLAGTHSLAGTNALFAINEVTNDIRTLGFIGREQMAWRDRLFVTAGLRSDKNSAFGVNYKRIFYPSVSASWVISDESFFPRIAAISSLRLRSAVGAAGQNPGYLASELYFQPVAVTVGGTDFP
ncbi:MAG: TonB-dependent receptor plug domain-containing protein, partial [Gemmatimonadales bacterium]